MVDTMGYSRAELEAIASGQPAPAVDTMGYSVEELKQIANSPEQKDFSSRLSDDYQRRIGQMGGVADQYAQGQISGLEANARMGLQYAQILPDAANEALVSGFRALPDAIESPIRKGASNVINAVADSPVGDVIRSASASYKGFEQKHPVAAGRIESALDVGNLAAPFVPINGKSAIAAIADTTKGAANIGTKGAAKVANAALPSIDKGLVDVVASAKKYNIPLSLDQVTGSRALKNVQKISQELPLSGHQAFRDRQMAAWNKAIFKTVGVGADAFTPPNMAQAFDKVGGEFDALTKGKTFNMGDTFIDDLVRLETEIPSTYGSDALRVYQKEVSNILDDFSGGDAIKGEVIASHRARLNRLARKASPSIAPALRDLEGAIVDGITSGDDAVRGALTQAKHRYKNLIVIEPLAAKARGGKISPSQLNARVSKIYGRSHVVGDSGDIGELARIGNELLPELGGSDTTQKMLYSAGLGGASLANPAAAIGIAGGLTANRLGQGLINRNPKLIAAAASKEAKRIAKEEAMTLKKPSADDIRLLKGDPKRLAAHFDETFGPGSAAEVLKRK